MTPAVQPGGQTRTTRRRGALLALAAIVLLASACTDSQGSTGSGELISDVAVQASTTSAHVPVVTVATSNLATVTVTATSGDHTVLSPTTSLGLTHEVPILGLRTSRDYRLSIEANSNAGVDQVKDDVSGYTTPPLPDGFPSFTVRSDPDRVSQGVTLIPLLPGSMNPGELGSDPLTGRLVGIDEAGEVVWYYQTDLQVISVEPTPNGTLLLGLDDDNTFNLDSVAREIDMLGNTLGQWSTELAERSGAVLNRGSAGGAADTVSVQMDSGHHDIHVLPTGNLIALSTELIEVDAATGTTLCPSSPVRHVVSDVVVEFERTGRVVGNWPISAVFNPIARPGSEMCVPPDTRAADAWMYPEVVDERDWTHANAVTLDEANNTLIVSLRSLDAVVGIRYRADRDGAAGELLWELGPQGDLEMQGSGAFPYHQHAPKLMDDGTLILYDNGNLRPGTVDGGGDEPSFSRAVMYHVDAEARTVEQMWEHRDESPWGGPSFSAFLGDADPLENGNVLITHGVVVDDDRRTHARIVEVNPDIEGRGVGDQVVFDLLIGDEVGSGWVAYHAAKVPTLYFRS